METPKRSIPLISAATPHVGQSPSMDNDPSPLQQDKSDQRVFSSRNLIETQRDWYKLCRQAGLDTSELDEHSIIFVSEDLLKELRIDSGDLVEIAYKSKVLLVNEKWRIVRMYGSVEVVGVAMSPLLWFNLCRTEGFKALKDNSRTVVLQRVSLPTPLRLSVVPWADDIAIKLISTFSYPVTLKLTDALSKYFSKTRNICLNDVIAVPRDCLDSGEFTMNEWAEAPVVYYKVIKLLGPWIEGKLADEMTFKVDARHSNLTQGVGCLNHNVPIKMEWFLSHHPPGPYWRRQPLAGLHSIHEQLLDVVTPYLQPMSSRLPATILLTGPPGCGKYSVVRALAVQLGLQMIKVNCHDLCGESAAATEARIRNLINKAQICTPSILLIENFEALGREKDPASYDVRIAAMFGETVRKTREKSDYPVILIATSAASKINTEMSEVFLHEFKMKTPNEEERRDMLHGLMDESPHIIDVISLARRTAGMVLSDMVTLVATARLRAHRRIVIENYGEHVCPGWLEERGLSEGDVSLTDKDVDEALHQLQTQHADALGAPKIPDVSWDDVGGLDDVKEDILDTIQLPLQHPELFASDLRRSGVLLYGPPGCGKTLVAKAVAAECSLNFLSVKGPELINMYVGQSEENIREVFSRARSAAPCVIFFDELDSLAPNRGRTGDSGGVMDRVVSQLLAELDGLDTRTDVFIIGATNRPDLLDPALTRPGRFDKLLYVGVPGEHDRQLRVLKALTRKFDLCESVDLEEITDRCPRSLTGADIYALCADAMMSCIRRHVMAKEQGTDAGSSGVTMDDFMTSLRTLQPSVNDEEMARYAEIRAKHKQR